MFKINVFVYNVYILYKYDIEGLEVHQVSLSSARYLDVFPSVLEMLEYHKFH